MDTAVWDWLQDHYFSVAQPNLKNLSGVEPLILASQQGRADVVAFLLDQAAPLEVLDDYGNNALWAACYAESSVCIAALIDAGIDMNYQNPASGATALMFAASSGREATGQQLLAAGADASLQNHDDFTALDLASTRAILKLLSAYIKAQAISS
jgi:ankyrin repeat protein